MSEKILCKCFVCRRENPELGGKLFTALTVKKHRKRELSWIKSTNIQNITHLENSQSIGVRWVFFNLILSVIKFC